MTKKKHYKPLVKSPAIIFAVICEIKVLIEGRTAFENYFMKRVQNLEKKTEKNWVQCRDNRGTEEGEDLFLARFIRRQILQ